jgi:hypothetical protein
MIVDAGQIHPRMLRGTLALTYPLQKFEDKLEPEMIPVSLSRASPIETLEDDPIQFDIRDHCA